MPHKVVVTRKAATDLEEIGDYIALDNPQAARETILGIRSRIDGLAQFPERYRVRNDLGVDRRILIAGNYLVVYRVGDDIVYVLRVSEGSRDVRRLLEDDDESS